jgi:phage/plasmid-like protein (TIGR03299 family)
MAHELDFSTGDAAYVQAGDRVDAWHRHGTAIPTEQLDKLTAPEQVRLIMERGRLDWTADPFDVFDESGNRLEGWQAFRRSDTDKLFGVFRDSYTIIQNRELFSLIEPMLDAGMVKFNTAGAIREGADVWALFDFNPMREEVRDFFAAETIIPHLLLHNNHTRERMLSIQETMVRVVCQNTLSAATGAFTGGKRRAGRYPSAVLLRHTKNVKSLSVEAVQDLWGQMTNRYDSIRESYMKLKQVYLQAEQFDSHVLDVIAPLPKDIEDPKMEKPLERVLARRELVTNLYRGEGRGLDGEPTAWNAYNAVVEAVDHYREHFKIRADEMAALFPGGTLANKKQDVLNSLTSLSLSA